MKKLESSLKNMVIVLMAVSIITGGILAWVNNITAEPIAQQSKLTLVNGIGSVLCSNDIKEFSDDTVRTTLDGKEAIFVVHEAKDKGGKPVGTAVESTTQGFGGDLKVLVGFDTAGSLKGYTILAASETPGLGAKADTWFQEGGKGNVIGRKLDTSKPLTVSKDGGDVDAITASTITSRAFLKAINQAYSVYKGTSADGNTGASPHTPH